MRVPVRVSGPLAVPVVVGVCDRVTLRVAPELAVAVEVPVTLGDIVVEHERLPVPLWDALSVRLAELLAVDVTLLLTRCVGVVDPLRVVR